MKQQFNLAQKLYGSTARSTKSDYFRFFKLSIQSFLLLMIVLFISSCQDDNVTQTPQATSNISERLQSLYRQKKHPETTLSIRDGGKLSVNDALDFLNDGLNFLYCRPSDFFLQTKVFKDTFSIAVDGSHEIESGDLTDLLGDIAEFAGIKYYAESGSPKEPLIFDTRDIGSPSPSYTNIEATFAMEVGSPLTTTDAYPYEDSWIYGQNGADVSEFCSEEEANADAADLFRRDLRNNLTNRIVLVSFYFKKPYVVCFSAVDADCFEQEIPIAPNYFPVDEAHYGYEIRNQDDVTSNDNLFENMLFYNFSGRPGFHTCLSDDEMNFHYEAMADLAVSVLPNPVGNKVLAQIEVGYEMLGPEESSTIFHSMLVVEASKIVIENEEFEEGMELPHP